MRWNRDSRPPTPWFKLPDWGRHETPLAAAGLASLRPVQNRQIVSTLKLQDMQIFVRSDRCAVLDVPAECSSVSDLLHLLHAPTSSYLVYAGKVLQDERELHACGVEAGSTIEMRCRLRGGKGGFGAILRSQGRAGNRDGNVDAMRDLQGRRIRHQRVEKELEEWKANAKERELEEIAKKHIKEQERAEKKAVREQVNEQEVAAEHHAALENVQEAVRTALAQASAVQASSSRPDLSKRKAEKEERAAPVAKKIKMMDVLMGLEDDDEDEER